jgi:hypothetical protein
MAKMHAVDASTASTSFPVIFIARLSRQMAIVPATTEPHEGQDLACLCPHQSLLGRPVLFQGMTDKAYCYSLMGASYTAKR